MITNALPPFLCTVYIPIINDAGASTATALLTTVLPNGPTAYVHYSYW